MHIPFADLQLGEQIGGGGTALVYRGSWHGTAVAVKRIFNPQQLDGVDEEFRQEVLTLQALRHPHVVQFLGACMRPAEPLCLVTELLPHSLHDVLHAMPGVALDAKRVLAMAADVSRAFVYLHHVCSPAVVHRDLKPSNLLVDRAWRVKVADYGLAANSAKQVAAGTPSYMAPELLQPGAYSNKVDVYSFAILLAEMISRSQPWLGLSPQEIKRQVLAGQRPSLALSCPAGVRELITSCWAQEPSQRPSFVTVLERLQAML